MSIGQIKGLSWADLLVDTSHQAWKDGEQPVYHPETLPASVIAPRHCWNAWRIELTVAEICELAMNVSDIKGMWNLGDRALAVPLMGEEIYFQQAVYSSCTSPFFCCTFPCMCNYSFKGKKWHTIYQEWKMVKNYQFQIQIMDWF